MIFPWLKGFTSYHRSPMTWLLFSLNVYVFLWMSLKYADVDRSYEKFLDDESFLKVQARVYAQFVQRHPSSYTPFQNQISSRALDGHQVALKALSGMAIRDAKFHREGASFEAFGDKIAVSKWQEKFSEFIALQGKHPGHIFGLSSSQPSFWKTISYQFVHGGALHLLTNMFFLVLFGGMLEAAIGRFAFMISYLVTGISAAYCFYYVTGLSMAPLIGASGAVNGLIGVFVAMNWNKPIRFFYFFLPKPGYWGYLYLPAWVFGIFWALSDIASLLATVSELGGIAYTAHMGGIACGLLMGLAFKFLFRGGEATA